MIHQRTPTESDPDQLIDEWLEAKPTVAELWQYALLYRDLGWNVIPLRGKKPIAPWKEYQSSRPSLFHLEKLFKWKGVSGIGVITGWISGHKATPCTPARKLCVRDFDTQESFDQWANLHPDLATTLPRSRTKRGYHVYCWSLSEVFEKFPDGEIKAMSKHFVVLPPSAHPNGTIYRWEIPFPTSPDLLPILDPREVGFSPGNSADTKVSQSSMFSFSFLKARGESGEEEEREDEPDDGSLSDSEWNVVMACLPDGPGQRERQLFELARKLKGLPHIADAHAKSLFDVIRKWWWKSLPVIRTKDWPTTWKAFVRAWDRVEGPADAPGFHVMMRTAAYGPEPPEAEPYRKDAVRRLVSVCATLQSCAHAVKADCFFLSCRTAAKACGFEGANGYRTAARWLNRLVQDKVIGLVKAGIGGTASRVASRYRFPGSKAEQDTQSGDQIESGHHESEIVLDARTCHDLALG